MKDSSGSNRELIAELSISNQRIKILERSELMLNWVATVSSYLIIFMIAVMLFIGGLTSGICNAAGNPQEIRVGSELDFPPYADVDKNGQPTGFSIELIKAVANAMGLSIKISTGPWDSVWNALVSGRIDLLPIVAKLPERQRLVDFSLSHTETYDTFFTRKGDNAIPNIAAAQGMEIVVMRSDAAHDVLRERKFQGKLIPVDTIPTGLKLVASGQYNAFLCSKLIGTLAIKEYGITGLAAGPIIPDYKRLFSFAVKKGDTELLEKLNQGLLIIKTNGEYNQIYEKWLSFDDPWQKVKKYLVPASIAVIVIAVLTLFWLVTLQRLVRKRTLELAEKNEMLRLAYDDMEMRVQERTHQLAQSNQAVKESEAQLRTILDATPFPIALVDAQDNNIDFWSRSALALFGHTAPTTPEWYQLAYPDPDYLCEVIERWNPFLDIARASNQPVNTGEYRITCRDGSVKICELYAAFLSEKLIVTFNDITDRKLIAEELTESRAIFQAAMDQSPAGIAIADAPDGTLRYVNDAGLLIRGGDRRTIVDGIGINQYVSSWQLLDLDHRPLNADEVPLARAILLGETNSREFIIRRTDDDDRIVLGNAAPIRNMDSKIVAGIVVFTDITESKRVEEALRRSEGNFRHSMDNSPLGERIVTSEGETVYANQALLDLYGYDNIEEFKTTPVAKRYTPESYTEFRIRREKRRDSIDDQSQYDIDIIRKNGEVRHLRVLRQEVYWDGKKQYQVIYQDVTELRQADDLIKARLRIASAAPAISSKELMQMALDEIELQTRSAIGFYHYLMADQETLSLQSWSTNTLRNMCTAEGAGSHYSISQAGVWVDCVHERRPVIHNDYGSLSHRKGMPPGHAPVLRELVVPIFRGESIVAIIGVGNKPTEYNETDIEIISYLGDFSWEMVERKLAEEKIEASLREKELLLKEIHHRVKNNLQIIASLINMQSRQTGDEKLAGIFGECQDRIRAMASVHAQLYRSQNFSEINFGDYIRETAGQLLRSYQKSAAPISLNIHAENVLLPIDAAIPCGLIINELVTNAVKYAFPEDRPGEIKIEMTKTENGIRLLFADNGIGLPQDMDFRNTETMGLKLVNMLVEQLDGTIEQVINGGTGYLMMFKQQSVLGKVSHV